MTNDELSARVAEAKGKSGYDTGCTKGGTCSKITPCTECERWGACPRPYATDMNHAEVLLCSMLRLPSVQGGGGVTHDNTPKVAIRGPMPMGTFSPACYVGMILAMLYIVESLAHGLWFIATVWFYIAWLCASLANDADQETAKALAFDRFVSGIVDGDIVVRQRAHEDGEGE